MSDARHQACETPTLTAIKNVLANNPISHGVTKSFEGLTNDLLKEMR